MQLLSFSALFAILSTVSVNAFSCYLCQRIAFTEKTTSNTYLQNFFAGLEAIDVDRTNCGKRDTEYTAAATTNQTCSTHCYMYTGTVSLKYGTESFKYETTARGCADSANSDTKDTCTTSSAYYETQLKSLLEPAGSSFGANAAFDSSAFALTGDICYCNTDNCNTASAVAVNLAVLALMLAVHTAVAKMM